MKVQSLAVVTALVLWVAFTAPVNAAPRLGDPQCARATVQPGDTAWTIARANEIPWDQFVDMNQHIDDLAKIWPEDELNIWCPPGGAAVAPPAVVVTATAAVPPAASNIVVLIPPVTVVAAIPTTTPPTTVPAVTTTVPPPTTMPAAAQKAPEPEPDQYDVQMECTTVYTKWRWDGSNACVSNPETVAKFLYNAGFRGDALVIMTAVIGGESNYDLWARGDLNAQNSEWGPSIGWGQVRSRWEQEHTGGPRDIDALSDPVHQAEALWRISSGGKNWAAWGAYTNGSYKKFLNVARAAVKAIGA